MKRQEHDFYKLLAKDIKELGRLIKNNQEAIASLKDITALIDGYFLESQERLRKHDIQVSLLQETYNEKNIPTSVKEGL